MKQITVANKILLNSSCDIGRFFVRRLIKKYSKNGKVVITKKRILESIEEFKLVHKKSNKLQLICEAGNHITAFLDTLVDEIGEDIGSFHSCKLFQLDGDLKDIENKFFKEIEQVRNNKRIT